MEASMDPEKKIFEGCLYMGVAAGHLTQISGTNVRFLYLWGLDTKFGFFSQSIGTDAGA